MRSVEVTDGSRVADVPVLGLGCSRIGSFGNTTPTSEIRALLIHAMSIGVTLFDTADVYGQGDSERELGRLIRSSAKRPFIMTKVGKRFSLKMRLVRPFKSILKPFVAAAGKGGAVTARRSSSISTSFTAKHILRAVQGSMRRLGVAQIDALLLHSPDAPSAADPAIHQSLAKLVLDGAVRFIGVSCDDIETLRVAIAIPRLSILQIPLPLVHQAQEEGLGSAIKRAGITVFAREVIVYSDRSPSLAVQDALKHPLIDAVIVGTSKQAHLDALASACAKA